MADFSMDRQAIKDLAIGAKGVPEFVSLSLTDADFNNLSGLIYDRTGIHLPPHKSSLLVSRLHKVVNAKGLSSFADYYDRLQQDRSGVMLQELIDRISTNFSYFYREKKHFEFFRNSILPELTAKIRMTGDLDLRFWCAGCATGEEAYTVIMLMLDFFAFDYPNWTAGLLATDISSKALQIAKTGCYNEEQLKDLPETFIKRFFSKSVRDARTVLSSVRKEVTFRHFNLLNPFPFKKPFHVIFCRNVMIYFDSATRETLFNKFYHAIEPGGYLFVGHSEGYSCMETPFQRIFPGIYRKPHLSF